MPVVSGFLSFFLYFLSFFFLLGFLFLSHKKIKKTKSFMEGCQCILIECCVFVIQALYMWSGSTDLIFKRFLYKIKMIFLSSFFVFFPSTRFMYAFGDARMMNSLSFLNKMLFSLLSTEIFQRSTLENAINYIVLAFIKCSTINLFYCLPQDWTSVQTNHFVRLS